jgi:hypothetical protein
MYIYNITIKIDNNIITEWLKWQLQEHIPEIMRTELFSDYKFFHLLEQDETEAHTYIVQFFTEDLNKYHEYLKTHAPALRKNAIKKWGDGFIAFSTLMETV